MTTSTQQTSGLILLLFFLSNGIDAIRRVNLNKLSEDEAPQSPFIRPLLALGASDTKVTAEIYKLFNQLALAPLAERSWDELLAAAFSRGLVEELLAGYEKVQSPRQFVGQLFNALVFDNGTKLLPEDSDEVVKSRIAEQVAKALAGLEKNFKFKVLTNVIEPSALAKACKVSDADLIAEAAEAFDSMMAFNWRFFAVAGIDRNIVQQIFSEKLPGIEPALKSIVAQADNYKSLMMNRPRELQKAVALLAKTSQNKNYLNAGFNILGRAQERLDKLAKLWLDFRNPDDPAETRSVLEFGLTLVSHKSGLINLPQGQDQQKFDTLFQKLLSKVVGGLRARSGTDEAFQIALSFLRVFRPAGAPPQTGSLFEQTCLAAKLFEPAADSVEIEPLSSPRQALAYTLCYNHMPDETLSGDTYKTFLADNFNAFVKIHWSVYQALANFTQLLQRTDVLPFVGRQPLFATAFNCVVDFVFWRASQQTLSELTARDFDEYLAWLLSPRPEDAEQGYDKLHLQLIRLFNFALGNENFRPDILGEALTETGNASALQTELTNDDYKTLLFTLQRKVQTVKEATSPSKPQTLEQPKRSLLSFFSLPSSRPMPVVKDFNPRQLIDNVLEFLGPAREDPAIAKNKIEI